MSTRLMLFGPPRVVQGDSSAALAFERRSQLLAHLTLRRGWAPRTELAAMLWPHAPMEQAHANLRKTLFRIRSLPWASAVVAHEQALAFDGTSDVADFESAVAQRRWADALEIGGAPLLAGFDDDSSEPWTAWLRAERERLQQSWRAAAGQCLNAATDAAEVLALSSRLLAEDPFDEPALRAQMQAYQQQGQPARARAAYRAYAARLAEELGAKPSAELQALHDTLATTGTGIPSGRSLASGVSGSEPHFVGRVAERRDVRERLERGCRLLSLVGPGGVGKSSLARALMSELAPRYADGAVFVSLEDVPTPDGLGTRLARALALPRNGGTEALQAVTAFLCGRRMLLVLDNFEHLQAAALQLQAVLNDCPRVQMLVTSRVRLGLVAEQLLPVHGLPCPEAEDADCLESFDAAQLFVRAAQAADSALQPTAEAAAIIDICRLVDGLPLALEIAAGWTRTLSCRAVADELQRNTGLLTEPDNRRPARHASMAAVFDQSWRCLGSAERSTWARLTVFNGGFTLEAARAVAGATLPILATLIDQSLVRKAGARADLHPLLRQLAATRLSVAEHGASRAAHTLYYLNWLVALTGGVSRDDAQLLQQVDVEFENVRAAWRWACAHGPSEVLRSAVLSLMTFCDVRGQYAQGLALLAEAAAGVGAGDTRLHALLDAAMAYLNLATDHYPEARALAERALLAIGSARDHDIRFTCLKVLGGCALETGVLPLARRRYRQALTHVPAAIDPRPATGVLNNLAIVERQLGNYHAARALYSQVLVERRQQRHVIGEAGCLNNLALLELHTDQIDAAEARFLAGLALCERHALPMPKMIVLTNLVELYVLRNDAAAAQRYGQRSLELARQMGAQHPQFLVHLQFSRLAARQGNLLAARDSLRAAVELAIAIDSSQTHLDGVLYFAELLTAQAALEAAGRLMRYVADHPSTGGPTRDDAGKWLAQRPALALLPAPALDLLTLLRRIVDETPTAHAALIETLRMS